jgi:hypothetical protein
MKRTLAVIGVIMLAACGKASETAVEKVVESQMEKDGGKAKVDLSSGGVKVTTTDASGKTSQMELGTAKVSEAEIGVPFYPGTQPRDGEMTRITSPEGSMVTVVLHSNDAPDKVAGFYRDSLKAQAQGKQLTDMSSDGSYMLTLTDDKIKQITQITVAKGDGKGSDIQIMANRGTPR